MTRLRAVLVLALLVLFVVSLVYSAQTGDWSMMIPVAIAVIFTGVMLNQSDDDGDDPDPEPPAPRRRWYSYLSPGVVFTPNGLRPMLIWRGRRRR